MGIIGVMLSHIFINTGIILPIISLIPKLVYTEGFLFLSGFGCFYSLVKNSENSVFYKKRFLRLYFPYFIITLPFFIAFLIFQKETILTFIGKISTLYFWFEGNFYGMWYIAISILLYALVPLVFRFVYHKEQNKFFIGRFLVFLLIAICIPLLLFLLRPEYSKVIGIGINRMWMFFLGLGMAYLSWTNRKIIWYKVIIIALVLACSVYILEHYKQNDFIGVLYLCIQRIIYIPALCIVFSILPPPLLRPISATLKWFGRYTLELYILHLFIFSLVNIWLPASTSIWVSCVSACLLCRYIHMAIERMVQINNKCY